MVPHPPDAETGMSLGDIGIELELEALGVPEVDEPVAAAFDPVDVALEELELEPPHAASSTTLSTTSPAPTQRTLITRPIRNIPTLSSRSSLRSPRHRVNP
jgi:hypothetical protein